MAVKVTVSVVLNVSAVVVGVVMLPELVPALTTMS